MEAKVILCDVCGATKGVSNHWFKAASHPERPGIAFGPSDAAYDSAYEGLKIEDICGQACLLKRLSLWATPVAQPNENEAHLYKDDEK